MRGLVAAWRCSPRSDAVIAVDLDYDEANWEQVKRLYARVIESGAFEGEGFVPPTLEGALGAAAASAGLSFGDDVKPLLGGTLYAGLRVEPAEPRSPGARDVLERLDDDATRFRRGGPRYVDRDGRPMDATEVNAALDEESAREPGFSESIAYEVTGLDERDLRPGPNRVVYGLIGDSFVVASSADLAREVETMPTEPAPEAATRLQIDFTELLRRATVDPGEDFELQLLRALVARAEASASTRDGDIEADAELLWARP